MILCPHGKLGFNEFSIDNGIVTLITEEEWKILTTSFPYDRAVTVIKTEVPIEGEMDTDLPAKENQYKFDPDVCDICIEQNELEKYLFDHKKIAIRQIDDDVNVIQLEKMDTDKVDKDSEVTYLVSKKARLNTNNLENSPDEKVTSCQPVTMEKTNPLPVNSQFNLSRRSKRSRKCKGDLEIYVSSFDTIKQLKVQIVSKLSRLISEQHLFFQNIELENEKSLADYRIHYTDVLYLKLDPITVNDENEKSNYEFAHLPEVGFKGTNLISR